MKNGTTLKLLIFCAFVMFFTACNNTLSEEELIKKAHQIHQSVLTIDTHNDTPFRFRNPDYDMAERHDGREDGTRMDFPRMLEGGLDAAFFAVFTGQGPRTPEGHEKAYKQAINIFNSIKEAEVKYKDLVEIATRPEDAIKAEQAGKIAMFVGVENGYPIGNDLSKVEEFYNLGARYITLCHSSNNDIADSSTDRKGPEHNGLSDFGVEVVREMNRLGMMVDISHASDETFYDVLDISEAPVIASHSSAKAICNSPRNLDDAMLQALQLNGGVIQLCILSSYIKEAEPNPERDSARSELGKRFEELQENDTIGRDALRKEWRMLDKKYPSKLATVQDAVDHIDHIVNLIGIDHVGIGTDFDGGGGIEGCYDASEMGNITLELVRRGYSKADIEKIWSGNIIRVMNEVQKVSERLNKLD